MTDPEVVPGDCAVPATVWGAEIMTNVFDAAEAGGAMVARKPDTTPRTSITEVSALKAR